jgi:hypothetical protein
MSFPELSPGKRMNISASGLTPTPTVVTKSRREMARANAKLPCVDQTYPVRSPEAFSSSKVNETASRSS